MYIHELAQQTGVPAKTIRYYESIGPLPRPTRTSNNYPSVALYMPGRRMCVDNVKPRKR
jgi:MerR-like DNA binding protein